jgi:hypothetical protein
MIVKKTYQIYLIKKRKTSNVLIIGVSGMAKVGGSKI